MQTQLLKTFIAIERTGSFAKAAYELNMTLSSVSMQMKRLEETLDISIFDRSVRPPRLTPLGRRLVNEASQIVAAEDRLISACAMTEPLKGTWRIGFVATASVRLLPEFLMKANSKAPNADFRIETTLSKVLEHRVSSGNLDAAVVSAIDSPHESLSYNHIRSEELVYAAPLLVEGKSIYDISSELSFLQFNPESGVGKLIRQHMDDRFSVRTNTIVLDSVEAIVECVRKGLGFTMLTKPDVERYGGNQVNIIPEPNAPPKRDFSLVYSHNNGNQAAIEALTELLTS